MSDALLIGKWALIRRNELVDIPDKLDIHPDFLQGISRQKFENAFRDIGRMFYQMYSDMADNSQRFGLPLYKEEEYDYFSNQAREVRSAPWQMFYFLFCLFAYGSFKGNEFITDTAEVRKINKAKKTSILLEALCDYGFVFDGIKLKGVKNYDSNRAAFSNGFISWNYKVLAEDRHTCSLAEGCDNVADKMHNDADREAVAVLDKILMVYGAVRQKGDPNEGPSLRYFRGKSSVYDYALTSDMGKLYLELRIRNAQNCLEYVRKCPERIAEDIPYYLKLMELGNKNGNSGI